LAVHVIGAHPNDKWTTKNNASQDGDNLYIDWLTDKRLLPAVAKEARIM
jgi:hypothetical protein